MVIAHITDIHISPDKKPVHDVDVASNFDLILREIRKDTAVSLLVLTGDICYESGTISTMEYVRERLETTGLPYHVIAGNHDDSVIMAQVFDLDRHLQSDRCYYHEETDVGQLIFLDTSKGDLPPDQLAWLAAVDGVSDRPSLIFMHHPPVYAVPYMNLRYSLEDIADVQKKLSRLIHVKAIYCGHYHVDKVIHADGLPPVCITPSTFFQIDDRTEEFRVANYRIGWRRIEWDGEQVMSTVRWIDPSAAV